MTLTNLALGNTDNHAKNHALLYTGARPAFAPVYDVAPVLIDDQVIHQMSFDIGQARMTDEITPADLDRFIRSLGYPRTTPALLSRLRDLVRAWLHGSRKRQARRASASVTRWPSRRDPWRWPCPWRSTFLSAIWSSSTGPDRVSEAFVL